MINPSWWFNAPVKYNKGKAIINTSRYKHSNLETVK